MPLYQPWSKSTSAPPSQGHVRTLLPAPNTTYSKECHAKTLSATGEKATCSKGTPALLLSFQSNCFSPRRLGAVRERDSDELGPAQLRWPIDSYETLSPRPRTLRPSRAPQVTAPEQPCQSREPDLTGKTGLGHTLPSSSPGSDRRRRGEGRRRAPPPHAPRPGAGRAHRRRTGAGARLEQSVRHCPGSLCPQGLQLPGRQDSPRGRCRGCPRPVGKARHGAAGRGSGHRGRAAARHFLTPPNFTGRRRRRAQPPPR